MDVCLYSAFILIFAKQHAVLVILAPEAPAVFSGDFFEFKRLGGFGLLRGVLLQGSTGIRFRAGLE